METGDAMDFPREESVTGSSTRFKMLLDVHPDIRTTLEQRLRAFPEYRSWVQEFGPGVLAALNESSPGE